MSRSRYLPILAVLSLASTQCPPLLAETPVHNANLHRECFEEGNGHRHCADLTLNCSADDFACLSDDLTGAIVRSGGDPSIRYAAYLARGIASRNASQISDAIADFESALAIQPTLATPLILLGRIYSDLGQHARAAASFDEADRRSPGLPVILASRADAKLQLGDKDGAIADLSQSILIMRSGKALPEGAEESLETLLNNRGFVWLEKGDRQKAIEDFKAALATKPGFPPAVAAMKKLGAS